MRVVFEIIGWILFCFGWVRLAVAMVNFYSRPFLPTHAKTPNRNVSVLVPARNERENLPRLLDGFAGWRDEVSELIIYDDLSTDGTYEITIDYAQTEPKIKVIRGGELPPGWLGKNHACHVLSGHASGELLLFIDADITLRPGAVAGAVEYTRRYGLEMLSLFPTQVTDTPGSLVSVPLMNWILLSLLPLPAVRLAPYPSLSAANGQFIMFTEKSYRTLTPHRRFRNDPVEDIAISRFYKERGLRTATLLGGDAVSCRMYSRLGGAVAGFSKNIFRFFGGSPVTGWLFVICTTAAPFWIFIFNGFTAGIIYVVVVILLRVFVSASSRQNAVLNVALMVPQQIVLWLITLNASLKRNRLEWKGRIIPSSRS